MKRLVSFSSLCAVLAAFSGCAADSGAGGDRQASAYVVQPGTCTPGDPTCSDPKCDPADANCDPTVPPCDPSDANCDPKVPPVDACAAQQVKADESCQTLLGFAWSGDDCYGLVGCACEGPDCDAMFKTMDECKTKYKPCTDWTPDFCQEVAKMLESELAAARACNISNTDPCDGTFVPTISGCPVPVASGSSTETQMYLGTWGKYADHCPLPVPACPDPKGIPVGCEQDPNNDGLIGVCSATPDGSVPGAATD